MANDEMDDSYGGGPVAPPDKGNPPESVDQKNEKDTEQTAVVSNKLLSPDGAPLKEGDEIVVKVVKSYGDECEIAYATKEESPETESTPEEDFAAMDQKG